MGGVGADKTKNLAHTREKILEAANNGAQVVVLPVSFSSLQVKNMCLSKEYH